MLRIDWNERTLLAINIIIAAEAISSIIVPSDMLRTLREERTIKQSPNRLDEELRMLEDLSFFSFIVVFLIARLHFI